MRRELFDPRVNFFIGDVRDASSLSTVMHGVDWVAHAAALKQVPSCEFFPIEAVKTNIIGTENVLHASINAGVDRIVALSTDKACYPVNAYGQTKALLEKVITAKSRFSKTICSMTRYGNVLASRGSVVPLFVDQIKSGKEITVTNPAMTRFLMTIDDAVDLVQYAFENGTPGDIFVKKSPAATVLTIAESLKAILKANNPIKIIGTRHGEKLHETLITAEEMSHAVDCGSYFRIPVDSRDLNYASYFSEGHQQRATEYTSHNTHRMDQSETSDLLRKEMYGVRLHG